MHEQQDIKLKKWNKKASKGIPSRQSLNNNLSL